MTASTFSSCRPTSCERGALLVSVAVSMVVVFGILSLALDFGRVSTARSELQAALDAAARYGVTGLADDTARTRAIAVAGQNDVDGKPLVLQNTQVIVGTYDAMTRRFSASGDEPNAVWVRVEREKNPLYVDLPLGSVIGLPRFPLVGQAFAVLAGDSETVVSGAVTGFVGLDWFNFNGSLNVRAWDSSTGQTLDPTVAWAAGQTRGPANLNSGVKIYGELQTNAGVSMNNATVTKGIKPLPSGFGNYPAPVAPSGATYLGNYNGPSGTSQSFAGGIYRFDSFNVPSGKTITFTGPASIYVSGSMNLSGAVVTSGNVPNNLKLFTTTASGVDVGTNTTSPLYANIYAPNSPLNLNGRTFYGSIIAKGINVNQPFNMYIDAKSGTSTTTATSTGTRIVTVVPSNAS